MRLLFLIAHPTIRGPLPKIAPLMVEGLRAAGVEVETRGWSRRREHETGLQKVVGRIDDLRRVLQRIRSFRPDAMLVTTTHDRRALLRDVPLMLAARRRCGTIVLHFHGSMPGALIGGRALVFRRVSLWLVRRADAVLVLSSEEAEEWCRLCPDARFDVVVNPFVPPERALIPVLPEEKQAPPTVLFAGRLIAEKGICELLRAVTLLRPHLACRVVIAGAGDRDAAYRHAEELGIDDAVEMPGYLDEVGLASVYRSADIFCLPTHFGEGFPTVISEAMSYGLPVVTTPIRGAADLLTDGHHCVFVPPRDPFTLAAALGALIADGQVRERMGAANRARVVDFAPAHVVPRYVRIIEECIAARDVGRADAGADPPRGDGRRRTSVDAKRRTVLGLGVEAVSAGEAAGLVGEWIGTPEARVICAANVHMVMAAYDEPAFGRVVRQADLVVADGRPVWWACRALGDRSAVHLRGADLMDALCALAEREHAPVGLFGADQPRLQAVAAKLTRLYPGLDVVYKYAPPLIERPEEHSMGVAREVRESGVRILFVALGCPKQEKWMAAQRDIMDCVMVGVGAAFDMAAGTIGPAPVWMQRAGLEWTYRLAREPRRLWRRYARHNSRFVVLFAAQLARERGIRVSRAGAPESRQ